MISHIQPFLSFQSYTLTGLNTYTQYLVSLKVFNPEGGGPETVVVVMTDEGGENFYGRILGSKVIVNKLESISIKRNLKI